MKYYNGCFEFQIKRLQPLRVFRNLKKKKIQTAIEFP